VKERIKKNIPFIVVLVYSIIFIIVFFGSANLMGLDMYGHYMNAYYIKEYFWPFFDGWNFMYFAGYPQGLFYPSLFHWLSAALSFLFPLNISIIFLLSLSILFFPIIFFLLAKKILKNTSAAISALLFTSFVYYFYLGLNSNLYTSFLFGTISNLFAITIFFVYLYFLYISFKNKKYFLWAGFFLAATIVSHVFIGLLSVLFSIILLIFIIIKKNNIKNYLLHLGIGALLSIFWWLPFLLNLSYTTGDNLPAHISKLVFILLPILVIINIYCLQISRRNSEKYFIKALCIFNLVIILSFFVNEYHHILNFIPIHFSRVLLFPFLITPIIFLYIFKKNELKFLNLNYYLLLPWFFYALTLGFYPAGLFPLEFLDYNIKDNKNSRIFITGNSKKTDLRFHALESGVLKNYNMPIVGGLFTESAINGWFIMSLKNSYDYGAWIWGYSDLGKVEDIKWASEVFGINYEYNINDKSPSEINSIIKDSLIEIREEVSKNEIEDLQFKYDREILKTNENILNLLGKNNQAFFYETLYRVNNTSLVEVLDYLPKNITEDWDKITKDWWLNSNKYDNKVLINNKNTNKWNPAQESKNLDIIHYDGKMDQFSVDASSLDIKAPIFIKKSYFPFWRAYNEKGEVVEIHRASPNFMLINEKGIIDFYYIKPWYYYLSYFISIFTLLLLILSLNKKIRRIFIKNNFD